MAGRKREPESRIVNLFATSEDRIDDARKAFETARTTLTNARTYGTDAQATAAGKVLIEAAENYADAMRTHARLVMDYAEERAHG